MNERETHVFLGTGLVAKLKIKCYNLNILQITLKGAQMDIKTFKTLVPKLPSNISVLVTGPTGVGKSDIFHQIGNELGLPVIDRRLSQMTDLG